MTKSGASDPKPLKNSGTLVSSSFRRCMKTNYGLIQNRLLSHLRRTFSALAIVGASLTLPALKLTDPEHNRRVCSCFNFLALSTCLPVRVHKTLDRDITFNVTAEILRLIGQLEGTEVDVIHGRWFYKLHGTLLFNGSLERDPAPRLHLQWYRQRCNRSRNLEFTGTQGT